MQLQFRVALKDSAKWLISHTKKSIKISDENTLYDNFFYGREDKNEQGTILEIYVDCYNRDITHRQDIVEQYNYRPSTKDQDMKEHHDSYLSNALIQIKNTRHLPLYYKNDEKGKTSTSNLMNFFAEFCKSDNRNKQCILITTASKNQIDPAIFKYNLSVFSKEDLAPWLTKPRLIDFIKYIEAGVIFFKEEKQKIIDGVEEHTLYNYQQAAHDKNERLLASGEKIDLFHRVGQGGGKTEIIIDTCCQLLTRGIHSVIGFPQLRLINEMLPKIVPKILATKGLAHTPIYVGSSRRQWNIEESGFDIKSFSVSELLLDIDKRDSMYRSGTPTLTLLCYPQLANWNKLVVQLKEQA